MNSHVIRRFGTFAFPFLEDFILEAARSRFDSFLFCILFEEISAGCRAICGMSGHDCRERETPKQE
jgi:hypothetical protein